MDLSIVPLDPAIADDLARAFSRDGWNKPAEQYSNYLKQQGDGEILCLVAAVAGAIAGYLKIVWLPGYPPLRKRGVPEIQDLNVLDKFRRRGVASKLLDHAEAEISKPSDVAGIGVGLHPGYNAALRLYVLRGYVPDGLGVTHKDEYLEMGQAVTLDDDLVLHFTKELRQQ